MILSTLLNQYLSRDPETAERLFAYAGKTVKIELLPFRKTFFITIHTAHISVSQECTFAPAVSITGTPLSLLKAWQSKDALFPKDISLTGEVTLLQELKDILESMDVDFTEALSQLTGDPLAHAGSTLLKHLHHFKQQTQKKSKP